MPDEVSEEDAMRYTRAYILLLLSASLMPNTSGDRVSLIYLPLLEDIDRCCTYSWGSVVFAYLYANLCAASSGKKKQIGGCLLLLQFWCWDRIKVGRPYIDKFPRNINTDPTEEDVRGLWAYLRWFGPKSFAHTPSGLVFYRDQMDGISNADSINWRPYLTEYFQYLSPICLIGQHIWSAEVPLVCFNVVEWHHPSRVMRQFGFQQHIPDAPIGCKDPRHLMLRKHKKEWPVYLREYIDIWNDRHHRVVRSNIIDMGYNSYVDGYQSWFRKITRKSWRRWRIDVRDGRGAHERRQCDRVKQRN